MKTTVANFMAVLGVLMTLAVPPFTHAGPTDALELDAARLEASFSAAVDRASAATVRIDTDDGMGSGTIIDASGFVLTSAHVVENAREILVTLTDGRRFEGRRLGMNRMGDLALVGITAEGLPEAPIGDSETLAAGAWVMAIGHPVSAFDDFQPTVSAGVVQRLDGAIKAGADKIFYSAIVSDTPLSPGSSGGGLWDVKGRLIGVNAAVTKNERGAFTVAISEYVKDATRLRSGEVFDRRADRRADTPASNRARDRLDWFASHLDTLVAERLRARRVVFETPSDERVAGVIVDASGLVLSASAPFAETAPGDRLRAWVHGEGRRPVDATLVALDLTNEVALLRLPQRSQPYESFDLAKPADLKRGRLAVAATREGGLLGGIIGAPHRSPPLVMTNEVYFPDVVQVDLRLEAHDIGAPVVDRRGALIGIVIQHRLRQPVSDRVHEPFGAFLLPPVVLSESLELLRRGKGRGERPVGFLGVRLEDLTELEKSRLAIDRGVSVQFADRRFPAHQAGIRSRDIILSIAGKPVGSRGQAIATIAGCQRDDVVPVTVLRNGKTQSHLVRIADRSDI